MVRPSDRARLLLPHPDPGQPARVRWWWIQQPTPTHAFALRGQLAAALGDVVSHVLKVLLVDEEQAEMFEAERKLFGEALALQTLRRARAGKALFQAGDVVSCTDRLHAVLLTATTAARGSLDSLRLFGAPERLPGRPDIRWSQPSLLMHLLMASGLRFDGEADQPRPMPDGPPRPPASGGSGDPLAYAAAYRAYTEDQGRVELQAAVIEGNMSHFTTALDGLLGSTDELELLATWAALHLLRPF